MKLVVTSGAVAGKSSPTLWDTVPGDIFWITDERFSGGLYGRGPFIRLYPDNSEEFALIANGSKTWEHRTVLQDYTIRLLAPGESITITREA